MSSVIFKNKNLQISFDEPQRQLSLRWTGFLNSDEFREGARQVIQAIERTKAETILSDNTDWKIITSNDHGWAAYNWFPEAEAKGIKKLATILSTDYFNRISERSIENMAEVSCLEIKNFRSIEEAKKWLAVGKTSACR